MDLAGKTESTLQSHEWGRLHVTVSAVFDAHRSAEDPQDMFGPSHCDVRATTILQECCDKYQPELVASEHNSTYVTSYRRTA